MFLEKNRSFKIKFYCTQQLHRNLEIKLFNQTAKLSRPTPCFGLSMSVPFDVPLTFSRSTAVHDEVVDVDVD